MNVLLAHPGTQHAPRLAAELERQALLHSYWTGLAAVDGTVAATALRSLRFLPPLRGLSTRILTGVPATKLHTRAGPELRALWQMKRGGEGDHVFHARNAAFQAAIPEHAIRAADLIVGFDTSSWILADRAEAAGKPFLLDRSIAHPTALSPLMDRLARIYPDWAAPNTARPREVIAAEAREHDQARRIVVGGSFARQTLLDAGVPSDRIVVNPYGVDWEALAASPATASRESRPLRFLFVGSVTARKGVPVLLDAWQRLGARDAELWLAGSIGARERSLIPDLPGLRVLGQVPRAAIPALYAQCDVFLLPSLFEGFGLVILEALAAGLPVVATPHTGAVEAVRSPELGRIVPVLDSDALAEAMRAYCSTRPDRRTVSAATATIQGDFSWRAYGNRWAALLRELH